MVERVAGRVVELSMHKFSSNLIEKCLLYGSDEQRDAIVAEMLAPANGAAELAPDESNIALNAMVKDQYANFCVGRALEVLPGPRTPESLAPSGIPVQGRQVRSKRWSKTSMPTSAAGRALEVCCPCPLPGKLSEETQGRPAAAARAIAGRQDKLESITESRWGPSHLIETGQPKPLHAEALPFIGESPAKAAQAGESQPFTLRACTCTTSSLPTLPYHIVILRLMDCVHTHVRYPSREADGVCAHTCHMSLLRRVSTCVCT